MEKEKEMAPPVSEMEQCTQESTKQDWSMVGDTSDTLMATVLMRSLWVARSWVMESSGRSYFIIPILSSFLCSLQIPSFLLHKAFIHSYPPFLHSLHSPILLGTPLVTKEKDSSEKISWMVK